VAPAWRGARRVLPRVASARAVTGRLAPAPRPRRQSGAWEQGRAAARGESLRSARRIARRYATWPGGTAPALSQQRQVAHAPRLRVRLASL